MSRTPTENQYRMLRVLGSGSAGLAWGRRGTEQLLRRGWVTAEPPKDASHSYNWIVITPDGLRALALAVERYGWPEFPSRQEADG